MANPSLQNVAGYRDMLTDVDARAAAAVATHVAQSDPHTQYQRETEKGVANGYASLDGSTTVPVSQIPSSIARSSDLTLYQATSQKNAASGYAGLNSSTRSTHGVDTNQDVIIDTDAKGIVLKDASAHYWRITVTSTGGLTTTDLGTSKP